MKVVALISGGKDSCYAMMRCIDHGHQIVALANLCPLDDEVDELDSYMYQTVGHQIVEVYAKCMGLPLFRRRIQGKARIQDLRYHPTEGDEVEDLEMLLRHVRKQIPTVEAVSSGAIASDYQRLRVENVCSRLGLVSLAYLWKQDQALLLQQMVENNINAILVKVAAIGLDPYKHLGIDISVMQTYLNCLNEKYGSNICGEGGEYESLTLDCPLFQNARIILDEFKILLQSPDSIAPVGVLHPLKFHLESKPTAKDSETTDCTVSLDFGLHDDTPKIQEDRSLSLKGTINDVILSVMKQQHGVVTYTCWHNDQNANLDVKEEFALILQKLELQFPSEDLNWSDVLYIHLYLLDMNNFSQVNEVYSRYIVESKCIRGVPSRCTVALPLVNSNCGQIMIEVLAKSSACKKVLHVQSISCWAPSCIGPYSQATLEGNLLYMAGQLGLDPPTMVLISGGACCEMSTTLKNCDAVAQAFGITLASNAASLVIYCSLMTTAEERREIEGELHNYFGIAPELLSMLVLFVQVSSLPKAAMVEVKPLLWCPALTDETEDVKNGYPVKNLLTCTKKRVIDHIEASFTCPTSNSIMVYGKFCQALISFSCKDRARVITSNLPDRQLKVEDSASSVEVQQAILCGLNMLTEVLTDANLSWLDVLVFRIYYVAGEICRNYLLESLSTREFEEHIGKHDVPQPILIPVCGLGSTSKMGDSFALDMVACRDKGHGHDVNGRMCEM